MAMDTSRDKKGYEMNDTTVEDLETELQEVLLNMDNIAQRVQEKN